MFLKCLDIYGFKSFADRTHIDFSEGITTLLGPNGCGKSNIVDSIKWVLGEQGTKTLRASKMEDVIFNGNDKRKPMPFAEVALTIDNSNGKLNHPASEIEIKRRIFRSGDTEYYLNRERCKLREIKELLMDTGVGKSAYSVLEQGKIDQIISMRPEDRRYIFEEAAGISKFKQQCNEANNKILKTEENITIVENTVSQVRRTYNRTKDQAEKARKYRELGKRGFELEVQLNICKVKTFLALKDFRNQNIAKLSEEVASLESRLEGFEEELNAENSDFRAKNDEISQLRIKATELAGKISTIKSAIGFIEERMRDLAVQEQGLRARAESLRGTVNSMQSQFDELDNRIADAEDGLDEINGQISTAENMIASFSAKMEENEAEIRRREEENERLSDEFLKLSDELKKVIEDLIEEVDENTSTEFSAERRGKAEGDFRATLEDLTNFVALRLEYIKGLKTDSLPRKKEEEDYERIHSNLLRIGEFFSSYKESIPPVVDLLLSPEGLISKKRDIEKSEKSAREKSEENRIEISSLRDSNARLRDDIESMRETLSLFNIQKAQLVSDVEKNREMKLSISRMLEERKYELEDSLEQADSARAKMEKASEDLKAKDDEKADVEDDLESVNSRLNELSSTISEQAAKLQRMRSEKENMISKIDQDKKDIEMHKLYITNADDQIAEVYSSFHTTYNRNLNEFKDYFDQELEQTLIENELREINKMRESAGNINYLAEDEFNDAKASLDFYTKQLDDLYKAKSDLEKVLSEIENTSKELFLKAYKDISANFQSMFNRLFGGGRAELSLQNEDEVLTTGVDIFAQPPGKKLTNMSLLSGGERSMTAVALLFATYKVKPSPFCILDEIDAALDDRNIGFFISVLEDFGKESQFIIITHNKHTVTAGESMLGVTQEEAGVSKTVSYRIKSIKGEPVILDENEREVKDFD